MAGARTASPASAPATGRVHVPRLYLSEKRHNTAMSNHIRPAEAYSISGNAKYVTKTLGVGENKEVRGHVFDIQSYSCVKLLLSHVSSVFYYVNCLTRSASASVAAITALYKFCIVNISNSSKRSGN